MKALNVAEARAKFGSMLDEAERGETVMIERRGVRFYLVPDSSTTTSVRRRPVLSYVHPDVMAGDWTWTAGAKGIKYTARGKKRS
jgi:hypothetical protein